MTKYWPNVKAAENDAKYTEFWDHEWTKHGTCSGMTQAAYFNATVSLIMKLGTPTSFSAAVGKAVSADTIRKAFGGAQYASLQCTSGQYVNGVFTCWERNSVTGLPTVQTLCPADVQAEDTCKSSEVTIKSF